MPKCGTKKKATKKNCQEENQQEEKDRLERVLAILLETDLIYMGKLLEEDSENPPARCPARCPALTKISVGV